MILHVFFRDFLVNNSDFETLRGRKNDFGTKILLETCSETSNYPWDTISMLAHNCRHFEPFFDAFTEFCVKPRVLHILIRFFFFQ